MKREELLERSLDILAEEFKNLKWDYPKLEVEKRHETMLYWPGEEEEEIMICVLQDQDFREELHRHDFFFFNYAYRCDYEAETEIKGNIIKIKEGECYIGQPFTGYGLRQSADDPAVVIGVLVQKQMFYRDFLPIIASDPAIFHFYLDPQNDAYSEDFMHFPIQEDSPIRNLLETMVIEYANRKDDTQTVLRPLVSSLLLYIARCYRELYPQESGKTLAKKIMRYMITHTDTVTLSDLGKQFSYHPNYISNLLRKDTGRSFSEILTQMRMERAVMLLRGTELPVEEISAMLGYADRSNFFKTFKEYYGKTPREYVNNIKK